MINIPLMEDDEVAKMNVKRAFQKVNITNPLAINSVEALAMLRGKNGEQSEVTAQRRLLLLDLNMPKMGGIEFLQELRSDPQLRSTPVVVMRTSNQDRDIEADNLNVAGYLLKPVTIANFIELMVTLNKYWTLCEMP